MNNKGRRFAAALTALLVGLAVAGTAGAQARPKPKKVTPTAKTIYCWEENGGKVCGDALPASAVGSAREEKSVKTGETVRTVDRALTAEEEAAKAANADAAAKAKAEQDKRDANVRFLVGAYHTEVELNAMFDEKQEGYTQTLASAEEAVKVLRGRMMGFLTSFSDLELAKKPIPEREGRIFKETRTEMVEQQRIATKMQQTLADFQLERKETTALYREAKAGPAGGAAGITASDQAAANVPAPPAQ